MGSIVTDIDGYVHLVHGKVICFEKGLYDLDSQDDVDALVALSETLYEEKGLERRYGRDTVCELRRFGADGARSIPIIRHIKDLPQHVQEAIRGVCHEHCG